MGVEEPLADGRYVGVAQATVAQAGEDVDLGQGVKDGGSQRWTSVSLQHFLDRVGVVLPAQPPGPARPTAATAAAQRSGQRRKNGR